MSQKKLTQIEEEIHYQVPFTTSFQKAAQSIVKELWKDQEVFFNTHGKLWLNQQVTTLNKNFPTVLIYSKVGKGIDDNFIYECDDEDYIEKGFHIEIINFENYSSYESIHLNIIGTDDTDLKGIALIAIMDIMRHDYLEISDLHEKIINIYKSNLDISTKKYCISKIIKEIDNRIERNIYKFNFKYPTEIIKDLNDIHNYFEWIEEGDSFIIHLALDAYQKITYYNEWLSKHDIEEKRFKEKIATIMSSRQEIRELTNAKPPFYDNLPEHPQDILHGLASNYWNYYGRKKLMDDDGIQAIIKIISKYKRMPKKSNQLKAIEEHRNKIYLQTEGMEKEEALTFIMENLFSAKKVEPNNK